MNHLYQRWDWSGRTRFPDEPIFLPLGFLTGLLGVNVGGIPGSDNPDAFLIFNGILVLLVAVQLWLFRRKRWL